MDARATVLSCRSERSTDDDDDNEEDRRRRRRLRTDLQSPIRRSPTRPLLPATSQARPLPDRHATYGPRTGRRRLAGTAPPAPGHDRGLHPRRTVSAGGERLVLRPVEHVQFPASAILQRVQVPRRTKLTVNRNNIEIKKIPIYMSRPIGRVSYI